MSRALSKEKINDVFLNWITLCFCCHCCCLNWHHSISNEERQLKFTGKMWELMSTHLIIELASATYIILFSICNLPKKKASSLHSVWFWSISQIQKIILSYDDLSFKSVTNFLNLFCSWKMLVILCQCMHMDAVKTRRVDRAANCQSNTDMENYQKRPLKRPIIIIMNQHTWKCIKVALPERTE